MAELTVRLSTDMGEIVMQLYPEYAPLTVANFVSLMEAGYYDGLLVHRVAPDHFIQTGCPRGTGLGGPGYAIEDEFSRELSHRVPGSVSMAHRGPGTVGSQFFITARFMPWLDSQHNCFGRVSEGLEVVRSISRLPRDAKEKPMTSVHVKEIVSTPPV
jgi:cyclophilin family peptidyl-prolyl cis-trans isomerase